MYRQKDVKGVKDVKVTGALAITALIVLGHASAAAQGAPQAPVRMEFDAVIKQAVEKNPTVAQAATNINRADALLQQSRAVTLPLLTATVSPDRTAYDGMSTFLPFTLK